MSTTHLQSKQQENTNEQIKEKDSDLSVFL